MQENYSLKMKSFDVGPMLNIIYLVWDQVTKDCIIVDPAWDLGSVFTFIKKEQLKLKKILLTHSHHDHVNSIDEILNDYDIPIYLNKYELDFWNKSYDNIITTESEDEIVLGSSHFKALHTPGHTPGSCCYLFDHKLIAGDTLFVFGCGRCDLHGGNPEQMFFSLNRMKDTLSKQTIILPGHNYSIQKQSTLEEEIIGNPFFSFDKLDEFVKYRMHEHDKIREEPYSPISL